MPCNCKKCDCKNRELCYFIENRFKSLICVFDKLADGSIPITNSSYVLEELFGGSVFRATNADEGALICGVSSISTAKNLRDFGGINIPENDANKVGIYAQGVNGGTINLLGDLSGLTITDFLPAKTSDARTLSGISDISGGTDILEALVFFSMMCIPTPDESGFCLRCTPIVSVPETICDFPDISDADFNDPSAIDTVVIRQYFAAFSQNLRYWVTLYGC